MIVNKKEKKEEFLMEEEVLNEVASSSNTNTSLVTKTVNTTINPLNTKSNTKITELINTIQKSNIPQCKTLYTAITKMHGRINERMKAMKIGRETYLKQNYNTNARISMYQPLEMYKVVNEIFEPKDLIEKKNLKDIRNMGKGTLDIFTNENFNMDELNSILIKRRALNNALGNIKMIEQAGGKNCSMFVYRDFTKFIRFIPALRNIANKYTNIYNVIIAKLKSVELQPKEKHSDASRVLNIVKKIVDVIQTDLRVLERACNFIQKQYIDTSNYLIQHANDQAQGTKQNPNEEKNKVTVNPINGQIKEVPKS